jgi:hypothetical protein
MKFLDTEALLVASSNLTTLSPSTTIPPLMQVLLNMLQLFQMLL